MQRTIAVKSKAQGYRTANTDNENVKFLCIANVESITSDFGGV